MRSKFNGTEKKILANRCRGYYVGQKNDLTNRIAVRSGRWLFQNTFRALSLLLVNPGGFTQSPAATHTDACDWLLQGVFVPLLGTCSGLLYEAGPTRFRSAG